MATIGGSTGERIIQMKQFFGLHECADGDTKLKFGEAARCENWKVTRDGNLKRREGIRKVTALGSDYTYIASVNLDRDDTGEDLTFTLYDTLGNSNGFIELSGTSVTMDIENWETYAYVEDTTEWYMESEEPYYSYCYRFERVDVDNDGITHWLFKRIDLTKSSDMKIDGLWSGCVENDSIKMIACCNDHVYLIRDGGADVKVDLTPDIGLNETFHTTSGVHMFGFDKKVYLLNGTEYYSWNGDTSEAFTKVTGYVPLVLIAIGPDGTEDAGGKLLEQINKLTSSVKAWLSPDGENLVFTLNGYKPSSVTLWDLSTTPVSQITTGWNYSDGKITFDTAPAKATNSIEVQWELPQNDRTRVVQKRYSELYSGQTDNIVFLYGDTSNECIYSDIDYNGNPNAEYFPDLNVARVGESNTPITGMIRHYSRLIAFKNDSTWTLSITTMTLEDGREIPAFNVIPVNKSVGNIPYGQVDLINNQPRTLFGKDLYEWRSNNAYSGNLTADERQAKLISQRIYKTLSTFNLSTTKCHDDNYNQEYYIHCNGVTLINNYAIDAWYKYDGFYANCFCQEDDIVYFGDMIGQIWRFDPLAKDDDGKVINAYWESGSLDMGADYMRKYTSVLYVPVKPESKSFVEITCMTDKKSEFKEKQIIRDLANSFAEFSFTNVKFGANAIMPKIAKLKLKAKKFVYYKLIIKNTEKGTNATVLGNDMKIRQTGYAK